MQPNLGSQWSPQGSPGGFSSDSGIPDANIPRVRPPRPANAETLGSSTYRVE